MTTASEKRVCASCAMWEVNPETRQALPVAFCLAKKTGKDRGQTCQCWVPCWLQPADIVAAYGSTINALARKLACGNGAASDGSTHADEDMLIALCEARKIARTRDWEKAAAENAHVGRVS